MLLCVWVSLCGLECGLMGEEHNSSFYQRWHKWHFLSILSYETTFYLGRNLKDWTPWRSARSSSGSHGPCVFSLFKRKWQIQTLYGKAKRNGQLFRRTHASQEKVWVWEWWQWRQKADYAFRVKKHRCDSLWSHTTSQQLMWSDSYRAPELQKHSVRM